MTVTTVRRVARKTHWCPGCHPSQPIRAGQAYLVHTEFPGGDSGYADAAGHPVRMSECGDCARRYGRGALLEPAGHTTN